MTNTMNEPDLHGLATRRVDAKLGFLIHAAIYLAVNGAMAISAQLAGEFTASFLWCAGAWTVALLVQGVSVLADGPGLRRRAIEAELARLRASTRG